MTKCDREPAASGPNEQAPFWSVMMPTYRPNLLYLRKNVRSLLSQNPGPDDMQIMLVDDASPDFDPRSFLDSIGVRNIACVKHRSRRRLAGNWNACIELAKGTWVHILHQDDMVLPGFYRRLRRGIEAAPTVGAAYCRDMTIDGDGAPGRRQRIEMERAGILEEWGDPVIVGLRIRASAIVVRRAVYREIGGFDPSFEYALDWDMWKRIASSYPMWYEPEIFACYRRHDSSATSEFLDDAQNIEEIRRSIEHSESYFPRQLVEETSGPARRYYTDYAVWLADTRYSDGHGRSAWAHLKAAGRLTSGWTVAGSVASRVWSAHMSRLPVRKQYRRWRKRRSTPVLAMSLLVRDEAGIIASNIEFHHRMGVDNFVVTDNGSVDGTRDILESLARDYELLIIDQPDHTMEQDKWVNHMADLAKEKLEADWIINGDADEFWLPGSGSLKSAIDPTVGGMLCKRHNLLPERAAAGAPGYVFYDNVYKVVNPVDDEESRYPRSPDETPEYPFTLRKVEVKAMCGLDGLQWIGYGNHKVKHRGRVVPAGGIEIYHYPVRTYAEFESKVVNHGSSLYNNPHIPQHTGWHVRRWYELYRQGRLQDEYESLLPGPEEIARWTVSGIIESDSSIRDLFVRA